MNKITGDQLLTIALVTLHFGNGVKNGNFEEHPRHTVTSELLQKFGINLSLALKEKYDIAIDFPTEANVSEWRARFKEIETGVFKCKRSRLNEVWQDYRALNLFYPMALIRRVLYNTMCQVNGYAETDFDSFD